MPAGNSLGWYLDTMTDISPEDRVEQLLAGIPKTKKCAVEENADLAAALRHFMNMKDDGTTQVTLHWFYENQLKDEFDGPSMTTVRRWYQAELRRRND